jgi:hypothetical protein
MNSKDEKNLDGLLDQAVEQIRADQGSADAADRAGERVWNRLTAEAGTPIRACSDFQELIPDFAGGRLDEARRLLVEDHTRECAACRRELMAHRAGSLAGSAATKKKQSRAGMAWTLAAAAVFVGLVITMALNYSLFLPASGGMLQVAEVDGSLLRVTGENTSTVTAGSVVQDGGAVRTARHSGALLTLADGSRVEMNERSELYVSERGSDSTIHLRRGSIIVQASDQGSGHLYVETNECLVAVTGTVFSVTHGARGSRVSVIEGEVNVDSDVGNEVLHAGDQVTTRAGLAPIPVEADIAWSRDMDQHLALLSEFAGLQREMADRLPVPGLRHDTRLLDSAPAGSVIYLAMPNLSDTINEAHQVLLERVQASEVLNQWWSENVAAKGMEPHIATAMEKVRMLGEELGPEIAVTLQQGPDGEMEGLVLLATLNNPESFRTILADELAEINANAEPGHDLYIVDDPMTLDPSAEGVEELLFWITGDLLVVSPHVDALQRMAGGFPAQTAFAGSSFHNRLAAVYGGGTQIVFGADVANMVRGHQEMHGNKTMQALGLNDADHLVFERKTIGGINVTNAELSFSRERQGVASWLAKPAPMGALDFISPEATGAAAFLVRNPAELLEELFTSLSATNDGFRESLDQVQTELNIDLVHDLASTLGGEFAMALDGPVLPVPAWKVVVEVYDPDGLQRTIENMVAQANSLALESDRPGIFLEAEGGAGGRTYYHVSSESFDAPFYYTFHEGYLLAGSQTALIERAIDYRASGITLTRSSEFKKLLPPDGRVDVSALIYQNLGSLLDPLLRNAPSGVTQKLSAGQEEDVQQVLESGTIAPSLTCIYGEDDQISMVNVDQGSILGSRLGSLLSLHSLMNMRHTLMN